MNLKNDLATSCTWHS